MQSIDSRLRDCVTQPDTTENFNRLLALVDALDTKIEALEARVAALEQPAAEESAGT